MRFCTRVPSALALLHSILWFAMLTSLPSPASGFSSPSIHLPDSTSSSTISSALGSVPPFPPAPSEFSTVIEWTKSESVNPLAGYTTAIELMYGLSKQSWNQPVELTHSGLLIVESQTQGKAIIYTNDYASNQDLHTGYVARALYELLTLMSYEAQG